MPNDFKIDDLISIINQIKNSENQNYQPVSQSFSDDTNQMTNIFSQIASSLQRNDNNSNPQDFSQALASVANMLNQNNSFVQNNQSANGKSDFFANLLGNIQNDGKSQQNTDIMSMISGLLGGNGVGNMQNQANTQNVLTQVLPALKNLQNTNNHRVNLLTAVKPFLGDTFSPHIDHGIRLVSIARTTKSALGGLGALGDISKIK